MTPPLPFGTFPKIHPFWKGSASLKHHLRECAANCWEFIHGFLSRQSDGSLSPQTRVTLCVGSSKRGSPWLGVTLPYPYLRIGQPCSLNFILKMRIDGSAWRNRRHYLLLPWTHRTVINYGLYACADQDSYWAASEKATTKKCKKNTQSHNLCAFFSQIAVHSYFAPDRNQRKHPRLHICISFSCNTRKIAKIGNEQIWLAWAQ